jgi:hypothetical protein
MRRSLRRRLLALLVITPAILVAADSMVWLIAARQVEAAFRGWVAARRSEGWQVQAGPERLGGWPLSAAVTVAGFAVSGGQTLVPGGLAWRSLRLLLSVDLLAPRQLRVRAEGAQRFRIAGSPEIALAASRIEAALPLFAGSGPAASMAIRASDPRLGPAGLDPDLIRAGTLGVELSLTSSPVGAGQTAGQTGIAARAEVVAGTRQELQLQVHATSVRIAHAGLAALGRNIALVSLAAVMTGPLPSGPAWTVGLSAWRDGGGTLTVRDFSLIWGPLAVGAAGRLVLDRAMQPAGEGTARILGYTAALDALVAHGSIGPAAATAAKAVLMLLARPSAAAGAPPEVDVPLRLEDRTLSVGSIPLLQVPALSWPPDP